VWCVARSPSRAFIAAGLTWVVTVRRRTGHP
jgi:hypothetical protein